MKTIVTHISLDLDAISSCWLIKRFLPNWSKAQIKLVPAGTTIDNLPPDSNPNIIHVDTGFGRFDHHQNNDYTCAAKLVFEHLVKEGNINPSLIPAVERIIGYVNDTDHFAEVYYPEPTSDRYEFLLPQLIEGLKSSVKNDEQIATTTMDILDGIVQIFKYKIKAEKEIENSYVFQSKWGKSLALDSPNEETIKLALKMGYALVVRRNPEKKFVRIKTLPKRELDLTPLYKKIIELDKKANWFLHASKNMLLNGSAHNPKLTPSSLSLQKLIEIINKM